MKYIDLHVHSCESDGTYTPEELVFYALEKDLAAFALTDHDTLSGIDAALKTAAGSDLKVIPGIEYACNYGARDIHILGLFINHKSSRLQSRIEILQESRRDRNKRMIIKLQETGIDISWEQMEELYGKTIWTRAHFAKYLVAKGNCSSYQDSFDRYLDDHRPCFVPREKIYPQDIIYDILEADGIPILAHPFHYGFSKTVLVNLIDTLIGYGLMGVEAIYSLHTPSQEKYLKELAAHKNLLISGGSDFHGKTKPGIDLGSGKGHLAIPETLLSQF